MDSLSAPIVLLTNCMHYLSLVKRKHKIMASSKNFNKIVFDQTIDARVIMGFDLLNETDFCNDLKLLKKKTRALKFFLMKKKIIITVTIFLSDELKTNAALICNLLDIIDAQIRDHFVDDELQALGWCDSSDMEKTKDSFIFSWLNVFPNRLSKKRNGETKTEADIVDFSCCPYMTCSFLCNHIS